MSGMNIQSLSIVVPTHNKCVNSCKFCVSRTHTNPYEDKINEIVKKFKQFKDDKTADFFTETQDYKDYINRLQYARDNGCNVVVLTGTGEPVQNIPFIEFFAYMNSKLQTPFKSIEVQTTGVLLDYETLRTLRYCGVTTMSFSISNIFDSERNLDIIGCAKSTRFDVFETIKLVKNFGFNLRLSLNLVNDYDKYDVLSVINRCEKLGADQVTFRKLYKSNLNGEIDKWIEDNASTKFYDDVVKHVEKEGSLLGYLPYGPKIYNIKEMSVVVDNDCMSNEVKDTFKYLILRENSKLYFRWETKSSLIF